MKDRMQGLSQQLINTITRNLPGAGARATAEQYRLLEEEIHFSQDEQREVNQILNDRLNRETFLPWSDLTLSRYIKDQKAIERLRLDGKPQVGFYFTHAKFEDNPPQIATAYLNNYRANLILEPRFDDEQQKKYYQKIRQEHFLLIYQQQYPLHPLNYYRFDPHGWKNDCYDYNTVKRSFFYRTSYNPNKKIELEIDRNGIITTKALIYQNVFEQSGFMVNNTGVTLLKLSKEPHNMRIGLYPVKPLLPHK